MKDERSNNAVGAGLFSYTQILHLLKLTDNIRNAVLSLPVGTPELVVTERNLRRLVSLDPTDQERTFFAIVGQAESEHWPARQTSSKS